MIFTRVELILAKLGASSYLDKFKEAWVDDDTLPYIKQRQDLAELLPLGLQLRFFAALQDDTAGYQIPSSTCSETVSDAPSKTQRESNEPYYLVLTEMPQSTYATPPLTHFESFTASPPTHSESFSASLPTQSESFTASPPTRCEFFTSFENKLDLTDTDRSTPINIDDDLEDSNSISHAVSPSKAGPDSRLALPSPLTIETLLKNPPIQLQPNIASNPVCKNLESLQTISPQKDTLLPASLSDFDLVKASAIPRNKPLSITNGATLKEALKMYDHGKLILRAYELKHFLNKHQALQLCDIILQHEFQDYPNTRLSSSQLHSLAKSINELFPQEVVESYYCSSSSIAGLRKAKGRLLDKYERRLRHFRDVGLIKPRDIISKMQPENFGEHVKLSVQWLKQNLKPQHLAECHWATTREFRFETLLQDKESDTIHRYFREFPILTVPHLGVPLIEMDFRLSHPAAEDNFIKSWSHVAEKILIHSQQKYLREPIFRQIVHRAQVNLFIDGSDRSSAEALLVLPLLFSKAGNVNKSRRDTIPWKPTKLESRDGFILRVPDSDSLEAKLLEKKNFLAARCLLFQPTTVAVGPPGAITQSLVVIDDVKFPFDSLPAAFNFCFKCYFALNAKYPVECAATYDFIQRFVFGLAKKTNDRFHRSGQDLWNCINLTKNYGSAKNIKILPSSKFPHPILMEESPFKNTVSNVVHGKGA